MSIRMKYFVLKPKGTDAYAKAARKAMFAYSKALLDVDPDMAREVFNWAAEANAEAYEEERAE